MTKAIFVGESVSEAGGRPFAGSDARGVERRGGSGWRLAQILGTTPESMRASWEFVNLSNAPGEWDRFKVRVKAALVLSQARSLWARSRRERRPAVVMLGRRVAKAFDLESLPYFCCFTPEHGWYTFVSLPHPSGRSRIWNDDDSVTMARDVLREAGVL